MYNPDKENVYHIPVMLEECLEGLSIRPDGRYVDVTFGGGGHSRAIVERLGAQGRLYGFDQDADASRNALDDDRFVFVASNFRYLGNFMDYYGEDHIDGILADLGVSSHHFDEEERGFSFRSETPLLDMRMNARAGKSAATILNEYEADALADLFYHYGELKQARRIAASVVQHRAATSGGLQTVGQLLEAVRPLVSPREVKKQLACIFQALRIEVNDELGALEQMLHAALDCLRPGGRLVVMTYHSLEDRIVKNFLRYGSVQAPDDDHLRLYGAPTSPWRTITRKPVTASADELSANPRSRSAKLRIAEKI
ncbi:16S rRNA (cytosine(1402)-N(4))-methyltransferase RsmH [Porphyromonas loveana]|uniref:Ribosomal RNA small subunit methyltransferase H n=7 Tax=Porphyromonas loveana TaxID=1884669 RepID=A0A2U1FHG0_9PORP|nr:16S rRNA (cytosine(1402)-N(4))-methyltransferase RsmH [Porphyromonas loveana]PVZ11633.1 16S rRNA (cytosine1402-N4)-methyltransferase [Porphyromonas loveana]